MLCLLSTHGSFKKHRATGIYLCSSRQELDGDCGRSANGRRSGSDFGIKDIPETEARCIETLCPDPIESSTARMKILNIV